MRLLVLFIICTAINVVLSTIKSIVTVKGGKLAAALINAITFGFYTYVVVLTADDGLSTTAKMVITAICNFLGVYIVKVFEEKLRKDKLWKIDVTVPTKWKEAIDLDLRAVPHNYIEISPKHTLFNFYCATQNESRQVKAICDQYEPKYFASETKLL